MTAKQLTTLLRLQEVDLTLLQLKREAQALPERKAVHLKRLQESDEKVSLAKQRLRDAELQVRSAEQAVEQVKEKIKKYRMQQMDVKSNEAFRAMEQQISDCQHEITAEEDKELVCMELIPQAEAELNNTRKRHEDIAAEVQQECDRIDARLETVRAQFQELKDGREALTESIEPDLMKRYLIHLSAKQDAFVVPAKQQTCGGCHMKLSPQTLHDLHAAVKWTACTFCGRLLYDPAMLPN